VSDSLVYRYNPRAQPGRGARRGRHLLGVLVLVSRGARPRRALDEARLAFEKMLTYANHAGPHAEQVSRAGQQQGNCPQALTHLALISAALNLDRALGA
jgi:GH15 family glucan-1,4-alpha-glucosidase